MLLKKKRKKRMRRKISILRLKTNVIDQRKTKLITIRKKLEILIFVYLF